MEKSKFGYLALAGVFALSLALAGCGNNSTSNSNTSNTSNAADTTNTDNANEVVSEGWGYLPSTGTNLDAETQAIFEEGVKGIDAEGYTPVSVLATQVVAGLNYAFLCDTGSGWHVVTVYKDVQGKSSMTEDKAVEVDGLKIADEDASTEKLVGAWEIAMPESSDAIESGLADVFDKAAKEYTGVSFAPIAVIGNQVVAGINYRYLCEGEPAVKDPSPALYVVEVYNDLDGNAEITSVAKFDLLSYIAS